VTGSLHGLLEMSAVHTNECSQTLLINSRVGSVLVGIVSHMNLPLFSVDQRRPCLVNTYTCLSPVSDSRPRWDHSNTYVTTCCGSAALRPE